MAMENRGKCVMVRLLILFERQFMYFLTRTNAIPIATLNE
jgi:hypothetical protein